MLSALQLLGLGGGRKPLTIDQGTIFVKNEDTTIHIYRNIEKRMTIYLDKDTVKRVSCNYSQFLPSGVTIASSTWEVEKESNNIVLTDPANDTVTTEVYAKGVLRDTEIYILNTITTSATIPETYKQSILCKTLRVV